MKKIRKAVIPVCGLDANYSPATKTIPMEMLPVLGRPLVQHVVDEAREAGIKEFIFITGRNKAVVENYFDFDYELNDILEKSGRADVARAYQDDLIKPGKAVFIHQQAQRGLADAILCARDFVGNEPFAVLLPTVLVKSKTACIKQLAALDRKEGAAVLAVKEVGLDNAGMRALVACDISDDGTIKVTGVPEHFADKTSNSITKGSVTKGSVTKGRGNSLFAAKPLPTDEQQPGFDFIENKKVPDQPEPDDALVNFALAGRYIFPPAIFETLARELTREKIAGGGEIQLQAAIGELARSTQVSAHRFEGISFDCACQSGLVMASMFYALEDKDMSEELIEEFIRTKLRTRVGDLLDANALVELADTLQKVADKRVANK